MENAETGSLWLQILAVVLGLIPFAGAMGFLVSFLKSKSKESKLTLILSHISEVAKAAVLRVEMTLKPKLVAALQDGVLTDKEKAELKSEAMKLVWESLPSDVLSLARAFFGQSLESVVSTKVEGALALMKQSGVASQVTPAEKFSTAAAPTPPIRGPFAGPR